MPSRRINKNHHPISPLDKLWNTIGQREITGDGTEAVSHLAAGRPIYYSDQAYPGKVIKKYPDGRRELVVFDQSGNEIIENQAL